MKLINWILLIFMTSAMSALIGCNNRSTKSAPPPAGCPAGMIATPAGCSTTGNNPPYGYIPPTGNGLIQYYAANNDFITQTNTLVPTSNYPLFLKQALGVCDRCQTSVGPGLSCDSWMAGFNMLMLSFAGVTPAASQMAFYSTPYIQPNYYQFAWQFPSLGDFFLNVFTGAPMPSCNYGQATPYWATPVQYETYNDGKGFVIWTNIGPANSQWYLYKFRLVVPQGKIGDPNLGFQLTVIDRSGTSGDLATGTLTRCQLPNCSMF
ncbi:MAG: hypothetical protein RJB66_2009 [Pseudomonadota bacterium]